MTRERFLSVAAGFTAPAVAVLCATLAGAGTPFDSTFTYQGFLKQNGSPVNGTCDFQFNLFDAASGGTLISQRFPTGVTLGNGLFTLPLNFGFTGDQRWLEIATRCPSGSGTFVTLTPRQAVTGAPYAISLMPNARVGHFSGATQASADFAFLNFGDGTGTGLIGFGSEAGVWAQGTGVPRATALRIENGGIQVRGPQRPVFTHFVTSSNIEPCCPWRTTISNPLIDGVSSAKLIVTPNFISGVSGVLDTHPVGVFFNSSLGKWQIFHQDFAYMTVNAAYNVLAVTVG